MQSIRKTILGGVFPHSLLLCGLLLAGQLAFSQVSESVDQLQEYARRNIPDGYSPRLKTLVLAPKGNLHYLFPFYNAFKDEGKFKQLYTNKGYYEELSQYFAFAGDYQTAIQYLEKSYDTIDDAGRRKIFKMVEGLKGIEHVDARRYIRFVARAHRVIMINEAYAKPVHRAFTLSLLADLYRQGFRYLAMEMLNNFSNHSLDRLNLSTGYYTAEPVAGEMVREALSMGYKLVSYEDTAASYHNDNQRDSIQAANLYKVIRQDTAARVLVYAGYAHISKKAAEGGHVPMGLAFKRMSGMDPLTIDQTDMTDGGNFGYGDVYYQAYLQRFPLKTASIAMINNEPVNVTNNDLYDLAIIHPPTVYQDGRPNWLTLDGTRKPTYIKPTTTSTFLVQAYYEDEVDKNEGKPWRLVPADQTYIRTGKKNYVLYLKSGKYTIYFRDLNYHILNTLVIEVN
jgi:hypothetical protein